MAETPDPRYAGVCGLIATVNGLPFACSMPKFHAGDHQAYGLPVAVWPRVAGDDDWQTGQNHGRPLAHTTEIP